MATVPKNFVTQREDAWLNTIQASAADDARAEVMWAGTTSGTTVTVSDSVGNDQTDLEAVKARVDSIDEVQKVTVTGSPTGGTFTLTFSGDTTSAIDYNDAIGDVESALEALASIGVGNVSVTGGALPAEPILVTFIGDLGGANQPIMSANGASLTGGSTPSVEVEVVTDGMAAL